MTNKTPVCISVINMKGGVGKTTIATHLCHAAQKRGLRVLAVDIDPQSNFSQALLGSARYEKFTEDGDASIVDLFKRFRAPDKNLNAPRNIAIGDVIKAIGRDSESPNFDLLPSQFNFSKVLIKSIRDNEFLLAECIAKIGENYDIIFIDCAPTESFLTKVAYHASGHILIPVKPEFLATIGFPLMKKSLNEFRTDNPNHEIKICGVVINNQSEYMENNEKNESRRQIKDTARKNNWHVYPTELAYSRGYPKSIRQNRTLQSTTFPGQNALRDFPKFSKEFFKSIGL